MSYYIDPQIDRYKSRYSRSPLKMFWKPMEIVPRILFGDHYILRKKHMKTDISSRSKRWRIVGMGSGVERTAGGLYLVGFYCCFLA